MFKKVFIEKRVKDNPALKNILNKLKIQEEPILLERINDVFGQVKKPYLQKRTDLNLFIGKKDGQLIKEAPDAYGLGKEKHFYYVHAYNCIYECQYCYLQGYFKSPDIVLYINHDDILKRMQQLVQLHKNPWFHAGEFSDSLALSHLTGELSIYFKFFEKNSSAKLELRTKSVNIKELLKLSPLDNVYISFSLSSFKNAKKYDLKCASIKARLSAIKKLYDYGYNIGVHFDPIVYEESFLEDYQELISQLELSIPLNEISYISLGVVRYTKEVYREVQLNYPKSDVATGPFIKSFDNKIRYNNPMRKWILNKVKELLINKGAKIDCIYLCME